MCWRMTIHTFVCQCVSEKTQLVKWAYNKGTICVMDGWGREDHHHSTIIQS